LTNDFPILEAPNLLRVLGAVFEGDDALPHEVVLVNCEVRQLNGSSEEEFTFEN
jgi:hypothetical protein